MGRKIIFQPIQLFKIILLAFFVFVLIFFQTSLSILFLIPTSLFLLYFAELLFFLKGFSIKKIKKPTLTKKSAILTFVSLAVFVMLPIAAFLFIKDIFRFSVVLLISDIIAPFIIFIIVFSFQPLAIILQKKIIKRAKEKREKLKNLIVIGLVGSYGKTSTKEFLKTILSLKFRVLATLNHQNTDMAIAKLILEKLDEKTEVFIVEMAAYKHGEIKSPCDIVKPKIGIIPGINEQHLALFGSMENLISAEGGKELVVSLPKDGFAVLNWDNEIIRKNYSRNSKNLKFYSLKKGTNIWAENIKIEKEFVSFTAVSKDGNRADFKVNVLGGHNILNILGAALVAKELGMGFPEIVKASQEIKPEQSGMVLKKRNNLNIIDSSYSANPDGVIADLEYLKIWPGKKVIIMPCLIELGSASKEVHKRLGKKIGEICDLAIITTKERFKEIKEGAITTGMKEKNILSIENPAEIKEKIDSLCDRDDLVLLEGRVPQKLHELINGSEGGKEK